MPPEPTAPATPASILSRLVATPRALLSLLAVWLTDITPFAGRFASMLGAWLMGAALYFAMRRWHGERVASIALLLTATCPFYFLAGQYANHDMLVAGLICTAIL